MTIFFSTLLKLKKNNECQNCNYMRESQMEIVQKRIPNSEELILSHHRERKKVGRMGKKERTEQLNLMWRDCMGIYVCYVQLDCPLSIGDGV